MILTFDKVKFGGNGVRVELEFGGGKIFQGEIESHVLKFKFEMKSGNIIREKNRTPIIGVIRTKRFCLSFDEVKQCEFFDHNFLAELNTGENAES